MEVPLGLQFKDWRWVMLKSKNKYEKETVPFSYPIDLSGQKLKQVCFAAYHITKYNKQKY